MTGFARINGCLSIAEETFSWSWELKSVNGKNLDIKYRLPNGYDDISISTKAIASEIINRGNITATLEITNDNKAKKIKIDTISVNNPKIYLNIDEMLSLCLCVKVESYST